MLEFLQQDLRYAVRQLARAPLFTTVSAVSLGVGIAVTVTVFSIVNAIFFKPLPVDDPDGLVEIYTSMRNGGYDYHGSSYEDLKDYEATGAFTDLAAVSGGMTKLTANDFPPANHPVEYVTPDFFGALGVTLKEGRMFSEGGREPEIIVSERYSRRLFESGQRVVGATLRVRDVPFTIVGVAPAEFHGLAPYSRTAAWIPAPAKVMVSVPVDNPAGERGDRRWHVVGRLAPGVTPEAAAARVRVVARELAARYPAAWLDITRQPLRVTVLRPGEKLRKDAGGDLVLLLVTVTAFIGTVLILACTNVAGLLLARAVSRRHEVAVRLTLGASRRRLVAQLATEAMLLALIGGALGFFMSQIAIHLAGRTASFEMFNLAPDWRIFASTAAACVACALIFGVTPTLHTLRVDVKSGLSGHSVVGERGNVRGRLMALQVALAVMLIVIGFSASRGLRSKLVTAPGFDVDGLLITQLGVPRGDTAARRQFIEQARATMNEVAGVAHTTVTDRVPLEAYPPGFTNVETPNGPLRVDVEQVEPEFFGTIGMRLISGRLPRPGRQEERRAAVVDRMLVERLGHDVVGGTIKLGPEYELLVIGVVESIRHSVSQGARNPRIYELGSAPLGAIGSVYMVSRVGKGGEMNAVAEFTRRMRDRNPNQVPPTVTTLRSRLEERMAPQRHASRIAFGIGAIELVLAGIGLYSLLLYAMLSHTREIGLRMALGAGPELASYTIMKDGLVFVLGGLGLGLLLGIPAAFFASRNFVGAQATDPVPFAAAIAGVVVATLAASIVPARKAARVQPMEALRYE